MRKLIYAIVATMVLSGAVSCSKEGQAQNEMLPSEEIVESETVAQKTVDAKTIEQVKAELAEWRQQLPIEGGVGQIITAVDYDDATNTIKYKYQYTVPGMTKPSEAKLKEAKKVGLELVKYDTRQKQMLDEGIAFRYDYYSVDDEYLYTMSITPEDIAE